MLKRGISYALAVILIAGTFFGIGWTQPEEAYADVGDTVDAGSIEAGDIIYYGNFPQTKMEEAPTDAPGSPSNGDTYTVSSIKYEYVDSSKDENDGWYKYEPIAWRVLENSNNQLFLLAEKAIDRKQYNETNVNMTWKQSTARSWLNGYDNSKNTNGVDFSGEGTNFIGNAFTSAEQTNIASTDIDNPPYDFEDGGVDTTDKIFYLKTADANSYFANSDDCKASATEYTVAQGAYVESGNVSCWLRSPGYYDNTAYSAAYVLNDGSLNNSYVYTANVAIRPAFYLSNLESLIFTSDAEGVYTAAKPKASVSVQPTAITGLTYTGAAQELVTAGDGVTGGTLKYKLDDGEYSTTVPKATEVGTYTVKYKVFGNGVNYNDSEEGNVTVRIISTDATLSSLTVSAGTLSPAFSSAIDKYTVSVPYSTSSITLSATKADANASVTGDGVKSLNVGANKFKIAVTAENETVKTYTVTITRAAPIPVVYPAVTSIKTPMTKMSIVVKKKLNLKNLVGLYTTGNKPIKDPKLTWTSSKPKVATVSKTGAVKAGKKTGTTVITVKAQNGKKLKITITVVKKAAKLKKLTGKVPKLKKGRPAFITLKGTGTNITGVKWKVKGKGLKIDKFGMATATNAGKYTITATAGGKKFTKKVTVK
jgi:hypothetical protein